MANHLKILQCNVDRSFTSHNEFINYFRNNKYDIALISEPYIGNNDMVRHVPGLQLFQHFTGSKVKSCILTKPQIGAIIGYTQHSSSNLAIVQLKTSKHVTYYISSVYIEPKIDKYDTLNKLESFLQHHPNARQVIGGDFNGWHTTWGSSVNNRRGNKINHFIIANELAVCNLGNKPTFNTFTHGQNRTSIIDLTLVSVNLHQFISKWKLNHSACPTSEHCAIEVNINMNKRNITKNKSQTTFRYTTKHISDWTSFKNKIIKEFHNKTSVTTNIDNASPERIDFIINHMTKIIQNVCSLNFPAKRSHKPFCPWWNEKLDKMKLELVKLHHRLHDLVKSKKPIQNILEERQKLRAEYSLAISNTSIAHFREYCNNQEKEDVWAVTNRLLKSRPPPTPPTTLKINNQYTTSSTNTAKALLNNFYPDDDFCDTPEQIIVRQTSTIIPPTNNDVPFTYDEIIENLKSMNPNRAPGVDHLTSDICLAFAEAMPELILSLINRCFELSYFPTQWKTAFVKVLPKPGKDDYSDLKSYRPIGLINVFGKLFKKLIISRLKHHIYSNGLDNKYQYGFKEQVSTVHALHSAINNIKDAIKDKNHTIAISLDIKAAFDNAWWPSLFNRLQFIDCPANIFLIIKNYVVNRKVILNYGDASVNKNMTRGCIQGSVCGPTFWNIILDNLLELKLPDGCHLQAFADDILLTANAKNMSELQDNVNAALSTVIKWGNSVKLTFCPEKTKLIVFTNKTRKIKIHITPNTILEPSSEIKLLGVILDRSLTFTNHVKYAIKKAYQIYKKLCIIIRPTWGINCENVSIIYKHVIEPIITYAAGIWGNVTKYKYIVNLLLSCQRSFAIKAIRGFRTISTTAAIALAEFTPIHLKISEIHDVELTRLTGSTNYLPSDIPLEQKADLTQLLHPAYRISISYDECYTQADINCIADNYTRIYTDGSKDDSGLTGCAIIIHNPDGKTIGVSKFKLHNSCSVFQAELFAINQACNWINKHCITKAVILSDSQSALIELGNRSSTNAMVVCIHRLIHSKPSVDIKFVWVKAHIGIDGNEAADIAAKQASKLKTLCSYNRFPLSYIRLKNKNNNKKNSNEWYLNSNTGTHTKGLLPDISSISKLFSMIRPNFYLTQFLTNHGYHKEYLHRFKICTDNLCPCDNVVEQSISHLLKDCPKYILHRYNYTTVCGSHNKDPFRFCEIIESEQCVVALNKFINSVFRDIKQFNRT